MFIDSICSFWKRLKQISNKKFKISPPKSRSMLMSQPITGQLCTQDWWAVLGLVEIPYVSSMYLKGKQLIRLKYFALLHLASILLSVRWIDNNQKIVIIRLYLPQNLPQNLPESLTKGLPDEVCHKPKRSYLRIQGEGIEPHWANESYVSGLGVENVIICGDPQTSMFGQDLHHLKIERAIKKVRGFDATLNLN